MAHVFSLLCFVYFFITAAIMFIVLLFMSPIVNLFDQKKRLLHFLTTRWGFHFVRLNPLWNCRFEGMDHLRTGHSYVIVANHQSLADIFVLSGLKHHFRWVTKESLMRIPFFGWIMKINGDVSIKRGDRQSIKEMMADCKQYLDQNVSILMFPEGTRSEDGHMQKFRDGSFRLSVDCGVPIVPIVITGTRDVIAKNSHLFNFRARMTVKILPPVEPASFQGNPGRMRQFVQDLMTKTLAQMEQETTISEAVLCCSVVNNREELRI
ncbi:hypothetical protein BH10CYA1_BH10CYA1_13440 [soil metagenome]